MTNFLIPLKGIPETFEISLAGVVYILTIKWCDGFEGGWVLDIQDGITNDSIVAGIPLITGANCLEGLGYLGIQGQLLVYTDGDATAVPTFENLGTESNLYFTTDVA